MTAEIVEDLVGAASYIAAHFVAATVIVLVMRRGLPVWGARAARASWIAFIATLVLPPSPEIAVPYQLPMALLGGSAVVVAATGLGSRLSRPPSAGTVRQATLAPRRLFVSRVPRQRLAAVVASSMTLAAIIFAGVTASGTTLVRSHRGASGVAQTYPGWSGGAPTLLAVILLLALTWWSLRQIEDRVRVEEPTDTVLRVRDASRVLRATTFAMATTGAVLLFSIGSAMNEATQRLRGASEVSPRSPWDPYQWLAFGLYVPAVALLIAALFALGGSISSRETLASLSRSAADTRPSGRMPSGAIP